jgi:hypothetical protein
MDPSKIFNNKTINWYLFTVKLVLFLNIIGFILLLLEKKEMVLIDIILYTILGCVSVLIIYLKHINKIKYENNELQIIYNYKSYREPLSTFSIKEKQKVWGINIKYKQLILENKLLGKKFKIDSDDWPSYDNLREFFLETKKLES